MTGPFNKALEIISAKGSALNVADIRAIEELIFQIDEAERAESDAIIYEAVALIVNDPLYSGDIAPIV